MQAGSLLAGKGFLQKRCLPITGGAAHNAMDMMDIECSRRLGAKPEMEPSGRLAALLGGFVCADQ